MSDVSIETMRNGDLPDVLHFWRRIEGLGLDDVDAPEPLARYLERNPGCSFVARERATGKVVGAVLSGHDGRRGYIHHLAVHMRHRRRGLGGTLLGHALEALRCAGLAKCHLFMYTDNEGGRSFYEAAGWRYRSDLSIFSKEL